MRNKILKVGNIHEKKTVIICFLVMIPLLLALAFLFACRYIGVGGSVMKVKADSEEGTASTHIVQ